MIRKMLLLVGSALALVAVAIPAAASAAEWNEPGSYHYTGHLVATLGGTGGPEFTCDATAMVNFSNNAESGEAEGEVEEADIIETNPNCHAVFPSLGGFTCTITSGSLSAGHVSITGTTGVAIENAGFVNGLEGCPVIEEAKASGTLTGTFSNADSCIRFSDSPHLVTPALTPVLVDGKLCPTTGSPQLV
jgi:hypothetical protein